MIEPFAPQDIELERFRKNAQAVQAYREGIKAVKGSGLLDFLRRFGRPFTRDAGANPYCSAYMAAFSEGYNKCLDDIMYFDEMYLAENLKNLRVRASFGGLDLAVKKGDLSQAEREKLNGK